MNKQRVIMFYDLCRLCLENAGTVDMFETEDLVRDIYICTAVKVSKKDNLPKNICTKCNEIVHSSKNLKVLASKNDSYLQSLFGDDVEDDSSDQYEIHYEETIDVIKTSNGSQTIDIVKSIFSAKDDDINIKNNNTLENYESHSSTPKIQGISIRKDIFESISDASSTPKRRRSSEDNVPHVGSKPDQNFPKPIKVEKNLNELNCNVCHKSFHTPKKLYLHQRLHSKNILCPIDACGKKFATKGDLEKHIRTHTGEKPYKCEICDRSFAQKVTLKSHREALHGGESYLLGK